MKDKKWSMIIGRNIDDHRRELGLTQYRLGELVGIEGKLIGRWCQGRHLPNVVALYRMSKIFGCSMEDLMRGVDV